MHYPETKLPKVGTTIFTEMSQLAAQHSAINLSQGFPDFDGPLALLDRVTYYLEQGHNQYAPMTGVPALRSAIALKSAKLYDCKVDPETEVTVTSGATEALFAVIGSVVCSGDEVIVFDPAYDSYEPAIELNGGKVIHLALGSPDFAIDWQQLKSAMNDRTRMIILNSPHNPTGSVMSAEDLDQLEAVIKGTDVLLLSDEVYEHICYDGPHQSLLRRPALAERAFVVSSFGKTYHTTGWKVGYCIAPPALTVEFRKLHQYLTFCTVHPVQLALADFVRDFPEHYLELPVFYKQKRDLFCQLMASSRFRFTPARGTYFQLMDYSEIKPEMNDVEFARWLTTEVGVAAIPISVFYDCPPEQRLVRFCFAKDDATLTQAAEKLCKI
ncbi:pyridoxal phosphate-dependent aminotransferase [Amphritea balenae]|uniref:Pyridoxal phosphate-dependent aminotransferase n=1 Tax=Amphritea balenae TaxID=452629 RepID=A0A3P1SS12_9GAMM|nr:pyridoxal phosphate-dependent aminotransferase [Amphritea balenae]RRC99968.1 pyridoxal phosphate-dependent aminotransferase [Amphritea balenae]GGK75431.1 aminotransferase [Amphritea balenae]